MEEYLKQPSKIKAEIQYYTDVGESDMAGSLLVTVEGWWLDFYLSRR